MVFAFIPDPEWKTDVPGTTGAEVGPRALKKYTKK